MADNPNIDNILSQLSYIEKSKLWGRYYLGEYYFVINTNNTKSELGLIDATEISLDIQIKLQYDNFPAIFHEYIHYVHEISTLIGSLSLHFEVFKRSLFSNYFDKDLSSSEYLGFNFSDTDKVQKLSKIIVTEGFIFGDNNSKLFDCIFIQPFSITKRPLDIFLPNDDDFISLSLNQIEVEYEYLSKGNIYRDKLYFGKYYIYEGLAYELDRLVDKQVYNKKEIEDNAKGTEYTVLRSVSKFLFAEIEVESYLSIASLSLSYLNPGETFVQLVDRLKVYSDQGKSQKECISLFAEETSKLLISKIEEFKDAQREIVNVFKGRKRLYKAFSFLIEQYEKAYIHRAKYPVFEVKKVLEGSFRDIVDIIPICDFIYEFSDDTEFNRDFLGTTIDYESSDSLKTLLTYSHYFKAHTSFQSTKNIESIRKTSCPFFYCCQLELRKEHKNICQNNPWRIFEISANSDNQFCWYGQGVLEFKGHNEIIN